MIGTLRILVQHISSRRFSLFSGGLILFSLFLWLGPTFLFPIQYPPGDDPAAHLELTKKILDAHWPSNPPTFYTIAITLHRMTGIGLETWFIYLPLIVLGTLLPLTLFLIFNRLCGFRVAALLSPFALTMQPIVTEIYAHGQAPESFGIFLTFQLLLLLLLKKFFITPLLFVGLFFTHHLTAVPVLIAYALVIGKRSFHKLHWGILGLVVLSGFILWIWPYYWGFFEIYPQFIFLKIEQINAAVPLQHILTAWRASDLFLLFFLVGLWQVLRSLQKKENVDFFIFLLGWLTALLFFSRFDYGDYYLSSRLVRTLLFPSLIFGALGFAAIAQHFPKKIQVLLSASLLIIGLLAVSKTNYEEFLPFYYQRIRIGDLEAIHYLKKNAPNDTVTLMPAGSSAWWEYLSGKKFLVAHRGTQDVEPQKSYWEILDGTKTDYNQIRSLGIQYILQLSPNTFYGQSNEYFVFDEKKLLATGRWEVLLENDRCRLFKLIPS